MNQTYSSQYQFYIPSHHPQGIGGDALVYSTYAKAICEMLANTTGENAGLTIGIFGEWGMGKSSVLQMVEDSFEQEPTAHSNTSEHVSDTSPSYAPLIVRFNAWRYAHQDELWLALLRRIFSEIERKIGWAALLRLNISLWWKRVNSSPVFWTGLLRIITKSAAISLVLILAYLILNFTLFDEKGRQFGTAAILLAGGTLAFISSVFGHTWNSINAILSDKISVSLPALTLKGFDSGQAIEIDTFLTDLDTIVDEFAKNHPLLVLIDDLDRCSPEQVVSILEAIKKFDVEPVSRKETHSRHKFAPIAFVLAADRRSIEFAVRAHFKDYLGELSEQNRRTFAREYIEKIVQVPFELPPLTPQKLSAFLNRRSHPRENRPGL